MNRALALATVILALSCKPPGATPADVVSAYFRVLGTDPIRTLALVTPEFHRRHGLHVATASDARAAAERRAVAAPTAGLAIDRFQLGWLAMQSRPELAKRTAALVVRIGTIEERPDAAFVTAHVDPPGTPGFEQRFALRRTPGGWRIDAVEQLGVAAANAAWAFAAWPNEALRRALAGAAR